MRLTTKMFLFKKKEINSNSSYSQEGEDLVLDRFFNYKKKGFYLDVGAMHPVRYSNTYHFYLKGWCGLNIDALPGSMIEFNKTRPRDINLEAAISEKGNKISFYNFSEPALNTFSKKLANQYLKAKQKLVSLKMIQTHTLESVIGKYIKKGAKIDFMNVDVEGYEMDVLKSLNWNIHTPTYILVEALGSRAISQALKHPVSKFLIKRKYQLVAKTYNTLIFGQKDNVKY